MRMLQMIAQHRKCRVKHSRGNQVLQGALRTDQRHGAPITGCQKCISIWSTRAVVEQYKALLRTPRTDWQACFTGPHARRLCWTVKRDNSPISTAIDLRTELSCKAFDHECLRVSVQPDKDSFVTVSTHLPEPCAVCRISAENNMPTTCQSSLSLMPEEPVTLLHNCSQSPGQAFTVTINRTIECTQDTCSPASGVVQTDLLAKFAALRRTLIWNLRAPTESLLTLYFPVGLQNASELNSCLDDHVRITQLDGNIQVYCLGGPVTHLDLPDQAIVFLEAAPKKVIDASVFTVKVQPKPKKVKLMEVTVEPNSAVTIKGEAEVPECNVCSGKGSKLTCSPAELILTSGQTVALEFSCLQPQDVFGVTLNRKIECNKESCPETGDTKLSPFSQFKRSLVWDISSPGRSTMLSIDFPGDGLQEIKPQDICQDGYHYIIDSLNTEGAGQSKYCRRGPVSHLELSSQATVTVQIPPGAEVDNIVFTVKPMARAGRAMTVIPDDNTIVTISRKPTDPECSVCVGTEPSKTCNPRELVLRDASNTSVEFSCPRPQDIFRVLINREIDCTEISCSGNIVQAESSLFPDFDRNFSWDLKVSPTRTFQLDFPGLGMRQIPNFETCPDEHTYIIITYLRIGPATIGTFCREGPVTSIQVRYKGRISLEVPGDRILEPVDFKVTVGPETSMLAIVKVDLPRGVSSSDFVTANYPQNFPNNQQMRWEFGVPGMHNYSVSFPGYSEPVCLKKEVWVEYQKDDLRGPTKVTLSEPQPKHMQGDFNMSLWNCETNRTLQGLAVNYTVSVMRSGHPVLCVVDLTKSKGIALQIEKIGADPYCEMRLDSVVKENITVAQGTKASLSFLDCPNEDLRLTASKTLGCPTLDSCSVVETVLTIPSIEACLPMPLHSFTWNLNVFQQGTLELRSPTGTLRQSLPGQECDKNVAVQVAEADGLTIGKFCPGGNIQSVQVHSDVSVTAMGNDLKIEGRTKRSFLNVTFIDEISESIIYIVSPNVESPVLLVTPNWPAGMRQDSTVSWVVDLPPEYQADLQFINISQPKCDQGHTCIKVQTLGSQEEMFSRREDEQPEEKVFVPNSFYLNLSNCIPEEGHFGVLTKVTLQKKSNLLGIILGTVGALLLTLIVLAIVCIVTKKKKGKMSTNSSSYIGKGDIFRPSDGHFPKARSDNDSHIYTSIDDTMVYGHLLQDSSYVESIQDHFRGPQSDSYRTFIGPINGPPVITEMAPIDQFNEGPEKNQYRPYLDPADTFLPPRPHTPIGRQDSLGFTDRRMVDNELYTFKSTGEINTIRLSAADPISKSDEEEESV